MKTTDDFLAEWKTAERDADLEALTTLLTDDFLGVGPLGFTLPKAAWLARHHDGALEYDTYELEERQTRRHGDAALVTARQVALGTYEGQPTPPELRASLTLVVEAGEWRLAGIHLSFIAGTPGAPLVPGRTS
jgi:ketosteroid isomerase-like protein